MLKRRKSTFITFGIVGGIMGALIAANHYISKQPSPLDKCRAMVIAEVKKNQQFVDSVAPVTFHEALGR